MQWPVLRTLPGLPRPHWWRCCRPVRPGAGRLRRPGAADPVDPRERCDEPRPRAARRPRASARSARGPRANGLRLGFRRARARRVTVDVFQHSAGRRVLGERRVAHFGGRRHGRDVARAPGQRRALLRPLRHARCPAGVRDVRRVALVRRGGRFARRPAFYRRVSCGLLSSFKLERPAFGGRAQPLARDRVPAHARRARHRRRATGREGRAPARDRPARRRGHPPAAARLGAAAARRPRGAADGAARLAHAARPADGGAAVRRALLAAVLAALCCAAPAAAQGPSDAGGPLVYVFVLDGLDGDRVDAGQGAVPRPLLAGDGGALDLLPASRAR